ncbi:signal peptidase I [Pseudomonas palleroniana]|uniref:Signal peptidase I n=1 Tax=Pseudomonas palleroniana TaxID=191390 RepID=A0A2L1JDA8_9PSED|nr:signal peptidase I [Pseudomonas palleroniana]AVE06472.1 signal peptidase I [Pseudomonas palleroniana]
MKPSKFSLLAFLMSCLFAGWGLVYVGRIKWAIRVAALMYIGVVLMGVSGLAATPVGLYVFIAFIITLKLASAIASAVLARRYDGPPGLPRKRFHALYVGVLIVIILLIFEVFRAPLLGFKNYFIPSGSMAPTLSVGDYIISDLRPGAPKVGDIVVYRWNGTEAVKRVAGIGGDTLAIVNGELIRNGENLGLFHAPAERVKKDYSLALAPLRVEPGHVYLLGDNRDVSNDSRFMGQVADEDVVGKVTGIWFSGELGRIGTTFP